MDESLLKELRGRVTVRFLDGEETPVQEAIDEYLRTINDRLLIQINADELPARGQSIVVDATVKALRLRGFEGSKSETDADGGSISNTFIDDVLASYSKEIASLKLQARGMDSMGVKFI